MKTKIINISDKNTKSVVMNIIYSFGIKGVSMFIGLFTTPAYIRYFHNNEIMGVWFTILSVLAWILNCDMGIGNGLRNKLVGAMKSDDSQEGKKYVSSAYIFSCAVAVAIILLVIILSGVINWNKVFNIDVGILDKNTLTKSVIILIASICLQLVLRLITSILYALQKAFIPSLLNLITNIVMLTFTSSTTALGINGSFINMAWAYMIAVNLPLVITTIYVFVFSNPELCPNVKLYAHKYAVSTLKIGGVFLWLQLMAMVLNSTNSYLVTLFLGNSAVVDYNIYSKIFTLIGTLVTLGSTPIWSAATKAQVEKNYKWLYSLFKKFSALALLGIIGDFILIIPLQFVFDLWLGNSTISVNYLNAFVFAIFGAVMIWSSSITCFVNGLGELKLQAIFLTIGAIIDIPLTYVFAKATNSYTAVCLANIIAFLPYLIVQTWWLIRYLRMKVKECETEQEKC